MTSGVYKRAKRNDKFRRSAEELREFVKENDIKLLGLFEYLRRRNDKKIEKGIIEYGQTLLNQYIIVSNLDLSNSKTEILGFNIPLYMIKIEANPIIKIIQISNT